MSLRLLGALRELARTALVGAARLSGGALALVFGGAALARGRRPLHPDGATYSARVSNRGGGTSGVPWLDEAGTTNITVRVSRAMGWPHESPDIYGMALRVPLPQNFSGDQPSADLLFASTGETAYGRFVLKLRPAAAHGPLTTLLPVRAPAGPLLLRLRPKGGTRAGTGQGDLSMPDRMTLSYAVSTGGWTDVATVDLGARLPTERDGARYDPIAKNLPGTQQYDVVRRLREPAYRAARRVRSQG